MLLRSQVALLLVLISLLALLALNGCGTNTKVCNVSGDCCASGAECPAPPPHLYAAGLNGEVTVYPAFNGALGTPISVQGPTATLGMAVLNRQFLYVSDLNNSLLDGWSINLDTGGLTTIAGSPFGLSSFTFGAGLAASSQANVVYVAEAGQIEAFKADATGALAAVAGSPFPSGTNLYMTVDPQGRFLFASDDDPPGSVFAFTIDSAGALHAVAGSPFPTTTDPLGNTQPDEIVVDSTGSFVYTTLRATGQVAAFSIDPSSGVLTTVPGSPFPAGSGPITLTTANNFVYVSNATDQTISGYSITPVTGVLTPLAGSPFPIRAGALTTDPNGSFFYAAGSTGILAFTIDSTTGNLTPITGSPFPPSGATVLAYVQ